MNDDYVLVLNFLGYIDFLCVISREEELPSSSIVASPPSVVLLFHVVNDGVFAKTKFVILLTAVIVERFNCHLGKKDNNL